MVVRRAHVLPRDLEMPDEAIVPPAMLAAIRAMEERESKDDSARQSAFARSECHDFLRAWLSKAMAHRRAVYEDKWARWRRNARNIYDPGKLARKERWQSALFVPLSMMHKEIIKGMIYRTLVSGLPYNIRPRPSGTLEESADIKSLVMRELERSKFELAANDFFDDLLTYGTAFLKSYWHELTALRSRRVPRYDPPTMEQMAVMAETGQPLAPSGYDRGSPEKVVTYRGMTSYHVSIWDMWFADGARSMADPHCQRYLMSYQDLLDGAAKGWAFPDAVIELSGVDESGGAPPPDKAREYSDLRKTSIPPPTTAYSKKFTAYEWWGELPQKWVYCRPEDADLITDPEALMPARALFSNQALISVNENDDYAAESPFSSTGYLHVSGEVYHVGLMEMLEQIQDGMNEDTNQRKDNVQLILNRMGVILERAIVSRADLTSRPGGWIRVKERSADDVNKAVRWLDTPDVAQSSYQETFHQERIAQELTGANRVTMGSGGADTRDITETKGGMQLIAGMSNDRIAYYSMLIEADFVESIIKRTYKLIYSNINPDEIEKILGRERASRFQLRSPEEVEDDYHFSPEGVLSSVHRPMRIAQWQAFRDQYKGSPFFDDQYMAMLLAQAVELPDADKVIVPMRDPMTGQVMPFQMMQRLAMAAQLQPQQFTGPGLPPLGAQFPQGMGRVGKQRPMPTVKPGPRAPMQMEMPQ